MKTIFILERSLLFHKNKTTRNLPLLNEFVAVSDKADLIINLAKTDLSLNYGLSAQEIKDISHDYDYKGLVWELEDDLDHGCTIEFKFFFEDHSQFFYRITKTILNSYHDDINIQAY